MRRDHYGADNTVIAFQPKRRLPSPNSDRKYTNPYSKLLLRKVPQQQYTPSTGACDQASLVAD